MLKFADLSVDFKSYENSFDSLTKLFPGSYYPLLIMYLAHKGLVKIETEFNQKDPRTLVSVDGKSLYKFFGKDLKKNVIQKGPDFKEESDFETAYRRLCESIIKDRDIYVMSPFVHLFPMILAGKSVALVADVPEGDQVLDLINILGVKNPEPNTSAALLFFSLMLTSKCQARDFDKTLSEEEIADAKKYDDSIWAETFELAMDKIVSYSNNLECIQPKELTKLILTKYHFGGSIYNPFAGVASYAVQLHTPCGENNYDFYVKNSIGDYYYAEEIDELTWAIGKLRLMALYSDSINYNLGDSSEWREGVADNVISTPPFGLKITNEKGEQEFADHFVVRRGMDMVVDGGLVACVVPLSFLSRKDTEDVRKAMVDNKWLESIVYLPENIFTFSKIRTAILFIRKEEHDKVIFADGTTSVYKKNKVNIIDDEIIANLLPEGNYDPEFALYDSGLRMVDELPLSLYKKLRSVVTFDEIRKYGYDLAPGEYFTAIVPEIEGFHLLQLKSLVKGCAQKATAKGQGKIIKLSRLSSDPFTPLSEDVLEDGNYDRRYNIITENALLVSASSTLRPTLFRYNGGKVVCRKDLMYAIYFDSDKILPEYLLWELTKGYVADQLRLKYKGETITRLSLDDFLSIYIQVPNIKSKEKELYEDQKILHFAKIEKELSALKDKKHDEYVKMLRQRKHRIQQLMNEFAPAFSLLDKCREKNGGILRDDDIVAARTGETVSSYFHKLHTIIDKVENLITNLVDKGNWGTLSMVNIDSYVDDIPQHHLSDKFDIQTLHDHDVYIEEEGETVDLNNDRFISINPDDLAIIFDNIIANASKWGFTDSIRRDYRIRIDVSDAAIDGKPAVRICISNNGNPIHPSVDRKRFFDWGYGSGTGIGTWQLKDTVEHYGGSIKLNEISEETSGFVTEYEIVLPLANED